MVVEWFCRSCHLALTHLRNLAKYPERFEYRVNKLDEQQYTALHNLLNMIQVNQSSDSDSMQSSPSSVGFDEKQQRTHSLVQADLKVLPPKTMQKFAGLFIGSSAPSSATLLISKPRPIPKMFLDAAAAIEEGTANPTCVAPVKHKMIRDAFSTPPLPAARGAFHHACDSHEQTSTSASGTHMIVPYIERAHSGVTRTTLRVRCPDDPVKRLWAEARTKDYHNHNDIIRQVADEVRQGMIRSKQEAQQLMKKIARAH